VPGDIGHAQYERYALKFCNCDARPLEVPPLLNPSHFDGGEWYPSEFVKCTCQKPMELAYINDSNVASLYSDKRWILAAGSVNVLVCMILPTIIWVDGCSTKVNLSAVVYAALVICFALIFGLLSARLSTSAHILSFEAFYRHTFIFYAVPALAMFLALVVFIIVGSIDGSKCGINTTIGGTIAGLTGSALLAQTYLTWNASKHSGTRAK